jgi:hypothetical protein
MMSSIMVILAGERKKMFEAERTAAGFTACALTASIIHRITTVRSMRRRRVRAYLGSSSSSSSSSSRAQVSNIPSGIEMTALVVNIIAASTNWIMFATEVPIVVDHMTGCRVHVLRWCEWTVLAFTMTYMVESVESRDLWRPVTIAATQGLSAACGLIFPFVSTTPTAWWIAMAASFLLYFALFPRWCSGHISSCVV